MLERELPKVNGDIRSKSGLGSGELEEQVTLGKGEREQEVNIRWVVL